MLSLRKQLNKVSFYCRQWMKHPTEVWSWCGASLEERVEFVRLMAWDCAADQQAGPSERALHGCAHCILFWSAPTPVFVWRPWAVGRLLCKQEMIWSRRKDVLSSKRRVSSEGMFSSNLNSFPPSVASYLKEQPLARMVLCACALKTNNFL